ncbi:hypothetical protein WICPIJ_006910 [Wickerhamomyces pijperi]|uniref:NADH:flavin oxidoreductase/NADH oxidase N-terminal domain-containing protein n=1 Tax=Wickerhamomyces pijperi TaxID=599730 RepID=A0A9P8Q2W0_WICPI|nr:hypothetical protein WICPIJ_006910 [Wickerhamomyces pijperi]
MTKDIKAQPAPEHLVSKFKLQTSKEVDFFLPINKGNAKVGHAKELNTETPKLFQPLEIIPGFTLSNRIGVSPMCTYSSPSTGSEIGNPTKFHQTHYGSFALRGSGLIIVESSAVAPNGRLSPEDAGIWNDEQAKAWKSIVQFAHSQGVKIGIQLGHGGRKASGIPPADHLQFGIDSSLGGWSDVKGAVVAPSALPFNPDPEVNLQGYVTPTALTTDQVKETVELFGAAAKRAYEIAGFDFVEIHGAHGYLINEFLSASSNKRTDQYGGSFENRIRFLLEIVDAVKSETHPTFLRISADELTPSDPDAWTIEDSVKLAHVLVQHGGVHVIDVSSGANNPHAERRPSHQGFQVPYAKALKAAVGDKIQIAAVGGFVDGEFANKVVENGEADIVLVGKSLLKNPGLPWVWADQLGVKINVGRPFEWPYYHPAWKF